jgi:type II secretory pathway component HofQ
MFLMQSNKTSSKKTRQIAETSNAAAPELKTPAAENTPREKRSSTVKKSETVETTSAKRHRKIATPVVAESAPAPKTMAAAAGASSSAIPVAPAQAPTAQSPVTHQQIAQLAHSYWAARGYRHGSPEEDWFRAENELLSHK